MSTTTINKILILKKYNEAKELRLNCQIRDVLNNIVDYIEAEEEIKTGKKNLTVEQLVRIKTNKRTAENMEEQNKNIEVVVIGHVDSGKSTTINHLKYKLVMRGMKININFKENSGIESSAFLESILWFKKID
uniref:Uncharacterized protein n=1 Tax=Meloidogyne enterolobii TaxID=390850 RepID=A0A6V7WX01_MELEN|nr:unnamed protein product [Meloidogyne enterolobii]